MDHLFLRRARHTHPLHYYAIYTTVCVPPRGRTWKRIQARGSLPTASSFRRQGRWCVVSMVPISCAHTIIAYNLGGTQITMAQVLLRRRRMVRPTLQRSRRLVQFGQIGEIALLPHHFIGPPRSRFTVTKHKHPCPPQGSACLPPAAPLEMRALWRRYHPLGFLLTPFPPPQRDRHMRRARWDSMKISLGPPSQAWRISRTLTVAC